MTVVLSNIIPLRSLLTLVIFLANLSLLVESKDCKSLKRLDYELSGTKTTYTDARNFLRKTGEWSFLGKKDHIPDSFDDDSLEEEHKDLLKDGCKPVVFYFVGRHSARYPDASDIEMYNKDLKTLQDKMRNTEYSNKCSSTINAFLEWKPIMQPRQDNLITDLGAREERDIARRFKQLYPEFFDTNKSNVSFGNTKKIRTAQTGIQFLREVDGLKIKDCDEANVPTNDFSKPDYDLDKIYQSACYNSMMKNNALQFLDSTQCQNKKKEPKEPLVERVKDPKVLKDLIEDISERLGFGKGSESPIDAQVLSSIFDTCKFENAIKNESVWCTLFDKDDAKALEFIEDVSTYYKGSHGPRAKPLQSCLLVKDLVETFTAGLEMTGSSDEKKRSFFYFSHAKPMKKLLGTFGLFKDDESYSESEIEDFEKDLKIPKKRNWRVSVVVPFSANMAFVLYRCPNSDGRVKHRVLTTVTEQPVKLKGCEKTKCNSEKFFKTYNALRECDLERFCA